MNVQIERDDLLPAVSLISGVVERRQTLPILGNVLIKGVGNLIEFTATDLEVEIRTNTITKNFEDYEFTLPARKFVDICKALPEGSSISIEIDGDKAIIRSERSKFTLGILPAIDYPTIEMINPEYTVEISEGDLKSTIEKTAFSMAQQDVRYYLNGMLFEIGLDALKAVATDGHRLALSKRYINTNIKDCLQLLVPRKAVIEISRLLKYTDKLVKIEISNNFARFNTDRTIFTTKLIDGRFPDYERVIPKLCSNSARINREEFKQSLFRASILSGEKYKGIKISFSKGLLEIQAHNPEQEEAEEKLQAEYDGEELTIGFNVGYLLDILSVLDTENIILELGDTNNSALVYDEDNKFSIYVVMPMRL